MAQANATTLAPNSNDALITSDLFIAATYSNRLPRTRTRFAELSGPGRK